MNPQFGHSFLRSFCATFLLFFFPHSSFILSVCLSLSLPPSHIHTYFPTDNYSTTIVLTPGRDSALPVVRLNVVVTVPQRSGSICVSWHGRLSPKRTRRFDLMPCGKILCFISGLWHKQDNTM